MTIIITKDVKSERRIGRKRLLGGNDRFHFATKCSYKTFYVFCIYYAKKLKRHNNNIISHLLLHPLLRLNKLLQKLVCP